MEYDVYETLDGRGLYCPMPLVKTKKALNGLSEGQIIKVLATDPGSKRDFISFCEKTGNQLLKASEVDGVFTYVIMKGGN
ncbi:MAG: sulfurtransferase TusA family protein [Candidatus Bathyarchaeota archaeon]